LKFIDNFEINLNLQIFRASQVFNKELMLKVYEGFSDVLSWLVTEAESPMRASLEQKVKTHFTLAQVTDEFVAFVFCAFKSLLRDRVYGFTFCPHAFLTTVPPSQVIS
jgi:hypothetical protein